MIVVHPRSLVAFLSGLTVAIVAVVAFQAWRADASPGESDTTFMPITPCRLIDTRPGDDRTGPFDAFGPNETETVAAHGTNGDCTIPTDAVGLSLNVTALDATELTFLTIWPDGDRPIASSLNPSPGQPPTPNAVTTNLSGAGSFEVFNLAGAVNVIIDVNGVYLSSSLTELNDRLIRVEAGEQLFNSNDPDIVTQNNVLLTNVVFGEITAPGTVSVVATTDISAAAGNDVSCQIRGEEADAPSPMVSTPSVTTTRGTSISETETIIWQFRVEPTESYDVGLYCGLIGNTDATYSEIRLMARYDATS